MKLPEELREALNKTGLPWAIEEGSKHHKIKLAGRLVGIYPKGKPGDCFRRSLMNTVSQVRRGAQEIKSK